MLKVDIADNPYLLEKGLMFVTSMEDDRGMYFDFGRPQHLTFWGANTYIPLDIAFVDADRKIVKIEQIHPHSLSAVSSGVKCVAAIEANAGYFAANGIGVGASISVDTDPSNVTAHSDPWGGAWVRFDRNHEGIGGAGEKDSVLKQSQVAPPQPDLPTVDKPGESRVGDPVTENVDGVNLPVLDEKAIAAMLEDSYDQPDEQQQTDDGQQPEDEQPPQTEDQDTKDYPVFSNAFEATQWAEQNGEVMRISYTTKHGRSLVRDVEPHGKFHSETTNHDVVVTFDETIGDVRAFVVTNIRTWAFVGRQFNKKFIVRA